MFVTKGVQITGSVANVHGFHVLTSYTVAEIFLAVLLCWLVNSFAVISGILCLSCLA